jgi:hypothetical protein
MECLHLAVQLLGICANPEEVASLAKKFSDFALREAP